MSSNYIVADFISKLNIASKSHFLSVFVKRTKLTIQLLSLLYSNGVIRGFVIYNDSILVYLKYHKANSVFSSLSIVSSPVNEYIEVYEN